MGSPQSDLSSFLQAILDHASQNFTFAKLLVLLHLDPNNTTSEAFFRSLSELMLANINIPNTFALLGAAFYAATFLMPRMIPLRVFGILSALFFIAYGLTAGSVSTFLLYMLLLPINAVRLHQILRLVEKARTAAAGDMSIDWLKSYMNARKYRKGDILFHKGDRADEMLLIVTGRFLVSEIGVELAPGRIMGELGFLTPNNRRTQTVECIDDGSVMTIGYDRLLEVYFEQPDFGYYLLRLATTRLLENNKRLESLVDQYKASAGGMAAAPA